MDNVIANIEYLKSEKKSISRKKNELIKHIDFKVAESTNNDACIIKIENELNNDVDLLNGLTRESISPFVEEISLINRKIGELNKEVEELLRSGRFIEELNRLTIRLSDKENELKGLRLRVQNHPAVPDKKDALMSISKMYSFILKVFKFPKLSQSHINNEDYYPYVRGYKYDQIGSLGGVTLATMAYYLAIFLCGKSEASNHLNFLMIDTPRKNLGANSDDPEFRDEEIYNSIIRYFIEFDKLHADELQLIVINNGYPDYLPKSTIVKEFPSSGKVGLIDDIEIP